MPRGARSEGDSRLRLAALGAERGSDWPVDVPAAPTHLDALPQPVGVPIGVAAATDKAVEWALTSSYRTASLVFNSPLRARTAKPVGSMRRTRDDRPARPYFSDPWKPFSKLALWQNDR